MQTYDGARPNIIPDQMKMELTLRYYNDEVLEKTIDAIKRICRGAALTAGMPEDKLPEVMIYLHNTPSVMNDEELTKRLGMFAAGVLESKDIVEAEPAMGGEDFGKYGRTPENVPICLMRLGSTSTEVMATLAASGKQSPHCILPTSILTTKKSSKQGSR